MRSIDTISANTLVCSNYSTMVFVPLELITHLQNKALKFFMQSQSQKDKAGAPDPFGYDNKKIGTMVMWVNWFHYLKTNSLVISSN
ncbi:hypothetical protein Fmac_025918 [Flemingia macrophylla]|uniref:Uncharacterized protein n=1 Tax=Flemingia macrophylla TaxID=520843 RepID=A0ABD1LDD6_9FABA